MTKSSKVPEGVVRNAITEEDGQSVNVGYLWLFWLGWLDVGLSIVIVGAGFLTQMYDANHAYPFTGVAAALAAVWGTYSTALGALGLFLMGDRRPSPQG